MKFPKWLVFFMLLQLVLFSILVILIITKQQRGATGPKGDSAIVDYKLLKNYVEEEIDQIPRPTNGVNGNNATDEQIANAVASYLAANPPAAGKDGADSTVPGPQGETGATGETGPSAPKYQQRCKDFSNKKSQVQWKYDNEETWHLLYELPHKCNGSLI